MRNFYSNDMIASWMYGKSCISHLDDSGINVQWCAIPAQNVLESLVESSRAWFCPDNYEIIIRSRKTDVNADNKSKTPVKQNVDSADMQSLDAFMESFKTNKEK